MGRLRSGKNAPLLPLVSESRAAWEAFGRLSVPPASIGMSPHPPDFDGGRRYPHEPAGFAHLLVHSSKTFGRPCLAKETVGEARNRGGCHQTVAENAVHACFTKVPLTSAGEKGNIVGLQAEW
jgi:hypothetical protein